MVSSEPEIDPLLQAYIKREPRRCPSCTYNLHGLQAARCPECGETLVLTLRGESGRRSGWIIGLVVWASGFGLFGLFVPLTILMGKGPPGRYWILYFGMFVTWPGITFWLISIRWFPRWSPGVRWGLTSASVLIVASLLIGVLGYVR